ncbi:MAG: ATP-dependent zinc metalloprotease FtsH [Spirochaetes bacterium]|uniref:ATP-dependent zinc metalloprotease FtsH n=1 Tax=Candidatus Gallitreponema excrementavium TaxID=2840840 RepID=A0A9D9HQ94_9SPIR|nr:ATP-dependent zinc metalloprotease FtsH [Candidatus Gallitreponema excrementavium]
MGKEPDKNKNENDGFDPYSFFKLPENDGKNSGKDKKPSSGAPKSFFWIILVAILLILGYLNIFMRSGKSNVIDFTEFKQLIADGVIVRVELSSPYYTGYTTGKDEEEVSKSLFRSMSVSGNDGTVFKTVGLGDSDFLKFMESHNVAYYGDAQQGSSIIPYILNIILPLVLIFLLYRFMFKRIGGGIGGSLFSAGGGRSTAVSEGQVSTRFSDVAGVDEAKEELVEVVDFLKNPKKYTDIGGKIPRGVLLVGPPGTGKTLLARAVAGEAGVPFFRISGSDFVEMFVGVGASRVRDLFKQAREKAPCIVFIDELDAIGKSRMNSMASNDEREQTLNQLLVEMDGFDAETGLIILAATNRPDVLDPALLRPGRFDRQVVVDRPDVKGREAILKIHGAKVKLAKDVDLAAIARTTSGFAGAELANVINESALLAVRAGRKEVTMEDLDEAVEKAVAGLQKKSRVIREDERRIVAFHETGHALTAAFTPGSDPVHKISIIPRGLGALGYTLQMPEEDRYLMTRKELIGEIDVLLGGRAAEEIVFGVVSTGAGNDIVRATSIARRMITDYGMSDKFKNVALSQKGGGYGTSAEPQLVREYSETTQLYVDEEIARVIDERYNRVKDLLTEKKSLLDYIAGRLLEKETIEEKEFNDIITAERNLGLPVDSQEAGV